LMTVSADKHITLSQLQQRIKSVIEQGLPLPLWVVAEIAECKVNYSGHCYLELVEKTETTDSKAATGVPKAQARAVIWRSQYAMLSAYFESQTGSRLTAGMKILAKVTVSYHELYGLSLQITDLDPSYTLGEVERQKQLTINQLQADGVWDCNREVALPTLVQRLAVVSSASAAGYRDFCQELQRSPYAFRHSLFEAVMQGAAAEESICAALSAIAEREDEFDAVIIIRGGGSSSDLSCFNSYRICSYVEQFPLAVITGIGHDKDVSVADMVAHTPLKTPTAVAAWLDERMALLEGKIDEAAQLLIDAARTKTAAEQLRVERWAGLIRELAKRMCERELSRLTLLQEQLRAAAERTIERESSRLRLAVELVEAHNPQQILRRGFAVVRLGGKAMTHTDGVKCGEQIEIELIDGTLQAEVKKITTKQ
jgi:exodeoxyribonuclease VII large subunit